MKNRILRSLVLGFVLLLASPCFGACEFMLTNTTLMDILSYSPETAQDHQLVELELVDGTTVPDVWIVSGQYLKYDGARRFSETDIRDIARVFDRFRQQIYP